MPRGRVSRLRSSLGDFSASYISVVGRVFALERLYGGKYVPHIGAYPSPFLYLKTLLSAGSLTFPPALTSSNNTDNNNNNNSNNTAWMGRLEGDDGPRIGVAPPPPASGNFSYLTPSQQVHLMGLIDVFCPQRTQEERELKSSLEDFCGAARVQEPPLPAPPSEQRRQDKDSSRTTNSLADAAVAGGQPSLDLVTLPSPGDEKAASFLASIDSTSVIPPPAAFLKGVHEQAEEQAEDAGPAPIAVDSTPTADGKALDVAQLVAGYMAALATLEDGASARIVQGLNQPPTTVGGGRLSEEAVAVLEQITSHPSPGSPPDLEPHTVVAGLHDKKLTHECGSTSLDDLHRPSDTTAAMEEPLLAEDDPRPPPAAAAPDPVASISSGMFHGAKGRALLYDAVATCMSSEESVEAGRMAQRLLLRQRREGRPRSSPAAAACDTPQRAGEEGRAVAPSPPPPPRGSPADEFEYSEEDDTCIAATVQLPSPGGPHSSTPTVVGAGGLLKACRLRPRTTEDEEVEEEEDESEDVGEAGVITTSFFTPSHHARIRCIGRRIAISSALTQRICDLLLQEKEITRAKRRLLLLSLPLPPHAEEAYRTTPNRSPFAPATPFTPDDGEAPLGEAEEVYTFAQRCEPKRQEMLQVLRAARRRHEPYSPEAEGCQRRNREEVD